MIEVFNLIVDTHTALTDRKEKKVAKKLYTETHMVSLIPYFKKAVEDGIDSEMMADWLVEFFGTAEGASVSELYNEAAGSGSAKSGNIIDRDDALSESFTEFFKADEDGTELIEDDDSYNEDEDDSDSHNVVDDILADMEYGDD